MPLKPISSPVIAFIMKSISLVGFPFKTLFRDVGITPDKFFSDRSFDMK